MEPSLTWLYLPTAVLLGALHALEPGHAKTLTAAYLIGIKGTKRDALLLGLSVATTHSIVVLGLAVTALWLGRETLTDEATFWLQMGSGVIVILLGAWLFRRRWRIQRKLAAQVARSHTDPFPGPGHLTEHEHYAPDDDQDRDEEYDHALLTDDEHAAAHAATLPDYVGANERPTAFQIMAFGGAGGLIPCPASVTVMLLALSAGRGGLGVVTVVGFSLGLAIALVGVGMAIVAGLTRLRSAGRMAWLTRVAPLLSAGLVMFSGMAAITVSLVAH